MTDIKPELIDEIDLRPDAWERFVAALKRVARHPPMPMARAMLVQRGFDPDQYPGLIKDVEPEVRVLLAEMREPTEAMVRAVPYDMYDPDFAENWRAMIDEALCEPTSP